MEKTEFQKGNESIKHEMDIPELQSIIFDSKNLTGWVNNRLVTEKNRQIFQ